MVQGRKPNWERRRRILKLRERGLSLPEIGRRLGVTFQCVDRTLRRMAGEQPRSVPCAGCGEDIISPGAVASDQGLVAAMKEMPERRGGREKVHGPCTIVTDGGGKEL